MNSIVSRIVGIMLSIFTIVYFGYQAYMMVYDPYATETALVDNYMDQIDIQGIAVKSEQLLDEVSSGIVNYRNTNSKKVLAGAVVASVYANQEDLEVGTNIVPETGTAGHSASRSGKTRFLREQRTDHHVRYQSVAA